MAEREEREKREREVNKKKNGPLELSKYKHFYY